MKLKHKLILDGILLVLLIVLTNYELTGGLIHELLGMVMLAGLLVHAFINRKYYVKMFPVIRSGRGNSKSKTAFTINMILTLVSALMLVSSLSISQELFPGLARVFKSDLWVPIHIVCAVVLLICVFIHVCLHAKMISAFIGQYADSSALQRMKSAGMRVMAFLFALLVVKSSFSNMADAASLLSSANRNQSEFDPGSSKQNNELIIEKQ